MKLRRRRWLVLVLLTPLAWGPTAVAATAQDTIGDARCAAAGELAAAGHPQPALDRIELLRTSAGAPDACADQVATAAATITEVRDEVAAISAAVEASGAKPTTKQLEAAQAAAGRNLDDPAAQALVRRLQATVPPAPGSWLHRRVADAAAWVKAPGHDLASLATQGLAVAVALILLARLALLTGRRAPRLGRQPGPELPAVALVASGVVAPLAGVWAWPTVTGDPAPWRLLPLLVVLAVATFVVWRWLFWRCRVRIEIQDKDGEVKAGSAAIVAHLRRLGAAPPRGLEIPLGTDVQALDGANITASVKGVLATLLSVTQTALGVTPWRVLVEKQDDAELAVLITRHGRAVDTAVVRTSPWADGPAVDPYRSIAAFVLMTMSQAYRFPGLAGATDWRSVAWQYEGADVRRSKADQLSLLARAASRDQGNFAAQLSFRVALDRDSDDPERLLALVHWLNTTAQLLDRDADLLLRARCSYNALVLATNLAACGGLYRTLSTSPIREARQELSELQSRLTNPRRGGPLGAELIADAEVITRLGSPGPPPHAVTGLVASSPRLAYRDACLLAQRDGPWRVAVLQRLRVAFQDPALRAAAATDPMLADIRASDDWDQLMDGSPRDDLLELAPFTAQATALGAAGLTTPEAVLSVSEGRLERLVGATAPVMRDRAELVLTVPTALADHRLEIVDVLVGEGIGTPAELARAVSVAGRGPDLGQRVRASCRARGVPAPDRDELTAYLSATPPPGPPAGSPPS